MTTLQPSAIIEYLQDNCPVLGWILDVQSSRSRILNIHQREVKLNSNRIMPWIGPVYHSGYSRQEILDLLHRHESARSELTEEIDPLEIWEMAQGEMQTASPDWFAGLFWDDPQIDQVSALGRKLLRSKTHFKFNPPFFEIYPLEKVEKLLEDQRINEERERLAAHGQTLLRALWEKHSHGRTFDCETPPDIQDKIRELLLAVVADPEAGEYDPLWKKLTTSLPPDPHLALLLAQAWEILPPHYNFLLDRAEYEWGDTWAEAFASEIQAVKTKVTDTHQPAQPSEYVSIDDSSTRDVDDAFCLEVRQDEYHLSLALACPPWCWPFDSELDRAVCQRATSLYLPEGSSHMLPLSLSTDFYSLLQGHDRPACLWHVRLDPNGQVIEYQPAFAWINVSRNTTYEAVEQNLSQPDPLLVYTTALELAQKLRANRIAAGAVITEQPDPKICLSGEGEATEVQLDPGPSYPQAQIIVSELMVLTNTLAAKWALEHDIPLIFRTQNITLPQENAGVWDQAPDIYRLIKSMGPSLMQTTAKKHATLGVEAYAPLTSPLRRYIDFMNMAQIISFLEHGQAVWEKDELQRRLVSLNARLDVVSKVQRMRPRYWKFLFFRQQAKKQQFDAILVEADARMVTVSLFQEQLFLRAPRTLFGEKLFCGQQFRLRLGKVDPLNGEITVLEAMEL